MKSFQFRANTTTFGILFGCLASLGSLMGTAILAPAVYLPQTDLEAAIQIASEAVTANQEREHVAIERAFPRLRFDRPVFLGGASDSTGRIFVVEQAGVIKVFDPSEHADDSLGSTAGDQNTSAQVFLDIRNRVSRRGNEEGLIGLAFHPDYKNNGQFFVHYSSSVNDQTGILSRFQVSSNNPNQADPNSEEVILTQSQPYRNHNGGAIAFGPDGYLYVSLGDGGLANDPHGHGQNLETWLGSILRIDIDKTAEGKNYAVPADNPFIDVENAKPELWAVGLRNVWRMAFDRKTGDLWAGDVGQDKWDEVDLIKRGENYGWNRFEADADFNKKTELTVGEHAAPIASYGRQWGISITGGCVYRGKQFPELDGSYFYGDYVSGNLWRVQKDSNGEYQNELVRRTGRSISAFGEDDDGEVYLLSFDGGVYRIVATDEPENTFADWPQKLSESDELKSLIGKQRSEKIIPYEVNAPFWSDGADKHRYFMLPQDEQFTLKENGEWEIPAGTLFIKSFEAPHLRGKRMLETRIIKRTNEGWEAATYVWNGRGTDAQLHVEGQQFELYQRGQRAWNVNSWHAPSSSECASCHTDAAGFVLGWNTEQLNRSVADGAQNQIEKWLEAGLVTAQTKFDANSAGKFCTPFDAESASLEERARVWLDVNCAMCHQPGGKGNANIDLRFQTKLGDTKMINVEPAQGNFGIKQSKLLKPGDADRSMLLHRINTLGSGRMPNVGSNQIDEKGVQLIREWIQSLED